MVLTVLGREESAREAESWLVERLRAIWGEESGGVVVSVFVSIVDDQNAPLGLQTVVATRTIREGQDQYVVTRTGYPGLLTPGYAQRAAEEIRVLIVDGFAKIVGAEG